DFHVTGVQTCALPIYIRVFVCADLGNCFSKQIQFFVILLRSPSSLSVRCELSIKSIGAFNGVKQVFNIVKSYGMYRKLFFLSPRSEERRVGKVSIARV